MSRPRPRTLLPGLAAVAAVALVVGTAFGKPVPASEILDRSEPLPERLRGIDVGERLGETVPKGVRFVDESGKGVAFGELFDGKHPVVLTLNYSKCPMLCSLELNGLVTALKQIDWAPGKEFKIATLVLDPKETPAEARASKERYLRQLGNPGAAPGWSFLTGDERSIRAVSDSVGFHYAYNEARQEYVHPAAIVLLSPQGKVSRYLYGIEYHPKTLRLSLADVAEGKVGSTLDQLVLFCFHYDEKEGRYAPVAMNIMRVSSGVGVAVLGGFLASAWLVEAKKKKSRKDSPSEGSDRSSAS
jgi:protein SCO1/2